MDTEIIWKPIPDFSNYEASNLGTIKNIKTGNILSNNPGSTGYIRVSVFNNENKRVMKLTHTLVCLAFHGKAIEHKMTVDHIDRNPSNNKPENLRWATHSTQMNNRHKPKERAGYPIWQICPKTKENIGLFENATRAAEAVGGHRVNIQKAAKKGWISNGFYWKYDTIDEIDDDEKWVKISRNNKEFYISNKGRIKNNDSINRLEVLIDSLQGYKKYICNGKGYLVHRLVAETFLENPNNLSIVNHKDCNKKNNDVNNLEWTTIGKNLKHAWDNECYNESVKIKKVYEIEVKTGKIMKEYKSVTEANKALNTNSISDRVLNKRIIDGIAWSYDTKFNPKEIKPRTTRINPGRKKVYKYDSEGFLVKEYSSVSEASREENIPQTSLKTLYIDKLRDGFEFSYEPPEN